MKRQKRDRSIRAVHRGYVAGLRGRSGSLCPYRGNLDARANWFQGWREGKEQYYHGVMQGLSSANTPNI